MTKNAFVTGITGGIGGGLIEPSLKRGYDVYGQYRSESKRVELEKNHRSIHVHFVYSELTDPKQLQAYFETNPREYDYVVLAAGRPGLDDPKLSREANIEAFEKDNVLNKIVFVEGFVGAHPVPPKKEVKLVFICSHVALLSDEQIAQPGFGTQIGYIYAMRKIKAFAEEVSEMYPEYFEVIIEFTDKVKSPGFEKLRAQLEAAGIPIGDGIDPQVYGEELLTKIAV